MEIKILILFAMIFCHIIDDYCLQGILASMKQKQWWEENYPDKMYKYDYKMALFMHSFSWSFMVMLVPTIYLLYNNSLDIITIIITLIFNICTHYIIDDMKANKKQINLIEDQISHIIQILGSWWELLFL